MDQLFNPDTLKTLGAGYALVQALAFFLARVIPGHTVVGKAARAVTAWPAQLVPTPVKDPADTK